MDLLFTRLPIAAPWAVALALLVLAAPRPAAAEVAFSIASGWAGSPALDADLTLASGATVAGDEGGGVWAVLDLRLAAWGEAPQGWGLGLAASLAGDGVTLFEGATPGQPSTVLDGELHSFTLQGLHRWTRTGATGDPLQLHAGLGAGVVTPRLGGRLAAQEVDRWEVAPTAELVLGLESQVFDNVGILLEARGGWTRLDLDLPGGAALEGDVLSGRLLLGIVLREGRR